MIIIRTSDQRAREKTTDRTVAERYILFHYNTGAVYANILPSLSGLLNTILVVYII
jgi:hypothetical protein